MIAALLIHMIVLVNMIMHIFKKANLLFTSVLQKGWNRIELVQQSDHRLIASLDTLYGWREELGLEHLHHPPHSLGVQIKVLS